MTGAQHAVSDDVAALLDECTSTCQLLAEQEEGPYRRGDQPRRRNVTEGVHGLPLRVGLRLRSQDGRPAAAVDVEIWHCDPAGRYSGYPPNEPDLPVDPSPQSADYLPDETFLRGRQTTDAMGDVEFHTIYPGWYPGRTVHIHLMVHTPGRSFVSQLYFPADITAAVFRRHPYRDHGLPDTTNGTDGIIATGGNPAVLDLRTGGGETIALICLVCPDYDTP